MEGDRSTIGARARFAITPAPLNKARGAMEYADGRVIARRIGVFVLTFVAVLAAVLGLASLFGWDPSARWLIGTALWLALVLAAWTMAQVEDPARVDSSSYWRTVLSRQVVLWSTFVALSLFGMVFGWEPWTMRVFAAALFVSFSYDDVLRWRRRKERRVG